VARENTRGAVRTTNESPSSGVGVTVTVDRGWDVRTRVYEKPSTLFSRTDTKETLARTPTTSLSVMAADTLNVVV
jgi:hypothetical protein